MAAVGEAERGDGVIFFLGTHEPSWLSKTAIPLFVSRRRLARLKRHPEALGPWALDSGGFTEIAMHGKWVTSPERYADEVAHYQRTIGRMEFAAIQDWMCEPSMIAKTGLSIRRHQDLTIQSYLDLSALLPGAPWCPVLQGWDIDDYLDHAEQYARSGVKLHMFNRVGVGSVCRRQASHQIYELFLALRPLGLSLHGFGLKQGFIQSMFSGALASFDSMAWSFKARKRGSPIEGCTHTTCSNCMRYAIKWRESLISIGVRPKQQMMYLTGEPS